MKYTININKLLKLRASASKLLIFLTKSDFTERRWLMNKRMMVAVVAVLALMASTAGASIVKDGITFDDNAFIDSVIAQSGSFATSGGTLEQVLTDTNEGTWAYSFSSGAFATL